MPDKTVQIVHVTNLGGTVPLRDCLQRLDEERAAVGRHHRPVAFDDEQPLCEVLEENRAKLAQILEGEAALRRPRTPPADSCPGQAAPGE